MRGGIVLAALAISSPVSADASFKGGGIVGVWAGTTAGTAHIRDGKVTYDISELKLEWRVLFADGHAFQGLPSVGLADLDRDAHKRLAATGRFVGGVWGTWTAKGTGAVATYPGNVTETLTPAGAALAIDAGSYLGARNFVRVPDITGLALEGGYAYNSNTEDAYYDEPGCRQIIAFARDGRFVDKGIFTANCGRPTATAEDAPGAGAYAIRDYTLVLRYDDGRVVRRSIAPSLAAGSPNVFVVGVLWQRRTKPLTSVTFASGAGASGAVATGKEIAWDRMTFVPPPGTVARTAGDITFTDAPCLVSVSASAPAAATHAEDFAAVWAALVAQARPDITPTPVVGTTPLGMRVLYGASMFSVNGGRAHMTLMVFTAKGRRFGVLLASLDEARATKCLANLAPTLGSLRLD